MKTSALSILFVLISTTWAAGHEAGKPKSDLVPHNANEIDSATDRHPLKEQTYQRPGSSVPASRKPGSMANVNFRLSGVLVDIADHAALSDLERIEVTVDFVKAETQLDLSEDWLQGETESALRRAGLLVVDDPRSDGKLYLNVTVVANSAAIALSFCRNVFYAADSTSKPKLITASVWQRSYSVYHSSAYHSGDSDYVVQQAAELVDEFLKAYFKANPRKP